MEQSLNEQLNSMMHSVSKNIGHYDLTPHPLYTGRNSQIFHISNRKDNKSHVLKVIYKRLARKSEEAVKMAYQRERNIHESLKNRFVLQLENAFTDQNNYYLVLEYCHKGNLRPLIAQRPNTEIIQDIGLQIAKALSYLHKKKIAHGDLKPENILLTKDQEVKLCDFGEAFRLEEKKGESMRGDFVYAPPEAIERGDQNRDIWAFGCILYEMATGKPPFEIKSWKELATTLTHHYLQNYSYPQLHPALLHLLKAIFIRDQTKRLKIEEVIAHPFFTNEPLPQSSVLKGEEAKKSKSSSRKKETYRSLELKQANKQNKSVINLPINQPDYKKLLEKKFREEKSKGMSKPSSNSKASSNEEAKSKTTLNFNVIKSTFEPKRNISPLRTEGMVIKEIDKKKSKIIIDKTGFTRRGENDQMSISCDGKVIKFTKNGTEKVYTLDLLPQKYYSKYQQAKMIVKEAMSCTPRATYQDQELTFTLMFNGIIQAKFNDGFQLKGLQLQQIIGKSFNALDERMKLVRKVSLAVAGIYGM